MSTFKYYDGDTLQGIDAPRRITFTVEHPYDDCGDPPWERSDCHGVVSGWERRNKRPHEWILCTDRSSSRFYDVTASTVIAKRDDGWGLSAEDTQVLATKLGRTPRKGDIAAESVRRDFEYLRRWCNNDWCYLGVVVTMRDADGTEIDSASVWGIESDAYEFLAEVAHALADELLHNHGLTTSQRRQAWRTALHEAREVRAWAERDVQTVGA